MAARECCLDQQELCEMLLLERALYSSAWSQLRDGAAGAATSAIVGLLHPFNSQTGVGVGPYKHEK